MCMQFSFLLQVQLVVHARMHIFLKIAGDYNTGDLNSRTWGSEQTLTEKVLGMRGRFFCLDSAIC